MPRIRATDDAASATEAIRKRVFDEYRYRNLVPDRGLAIGGRPALTGVLPSDVGDFVILTVRDPLGGYSGDQALGLASQFGPAEIVATTGLFQTATADADGGRVTVVTTGSGSPELELVLTEFLDHTDAHTYLYFGTAAGIHPGVHAGDVVISSGAVRGEALTRAYVDSSYPAVADFQVVSSFARAAAEIDTRFHVGVTRSTDSDTVGVGRPAVRGYMQPQHAEELDYWIRAGVLSNDREASAVLTLASLFGCRGGAVFGVTDNYIIGEKLEPGKGVPDATRVLVSGVKALIDQS